MNSVKLTIREVNNLPSDLFIKIFGNIVEHYPAAAIGILKHRPFQTAEDICQSVNTYLDGLSKNEKEKVLQFHPDLAGKLAEVGNLTEESKEEQASAGLDQITNDNKHTLNQLNERYKNSFGFPFVICARENTIQTILKSMESRLQNDPDLELKTTIEEVKKIAKLRILHIIKEL